MMPFSLRPRLRDRSFRTLLALFCALLLLPGEGALLAQETAKPAAPAAGAEAAPVKLPPDQLDSLVAPIALYPDPLLAQTLVAATYPLEIVQLQQFLAKNPKLKDKALADAVAKQPWDPSIQSMAAVPEVVKRLADDIQWTTQLGDAFLDQQSDVMDAVQRMRKKAQDKGALTSNEQQKVETQVVEQKTVIVVQPSNPEVIYVPSYNPTVVYPPPIYPYPPVYYPPPPPYGAAFVSFTAGVMIGAAVWGGSCCGCGWGSNNTVNVNVNNNYNRNANINSGNVQHNSAAPRRRALLEPGDGEQVRRVGQRRLTRLARGKRPAAGRASGRSRSEPERQHAWRRRCRSEPERQHAWRRRCRSEPQRQQPRRRKLRRLRRRLRRLQREQRQGKQLPGLLEHELPRRGWGLARRRRRPGRAEMSVMKKWLGSGIVCAFIFAPALDAAEPVAPAAKKPSVAVHQRTFDSARGAADALISAAVRLDVPALKEILGPDGADFVVTADAVQDRNQIEAFAAKAREKNDVVPDAKNPNLAILSIGDQDWPMPVPIVRKGGKWLFDSKAGRKEVLYRRIGGNELNAIGACHHFVEAQHAYALEKHDGSPVNQYAQKIISTPGKQDGLAWQNPDGTMGGPLGEGLARAIAEGYSKKSEPFHGFYFKVLKGQGPAAPLGKIDFVVEGVMIGGFALVAAPADYRVTGVKSFIVSHDGIVYEKDLGPKTLEHFRAMELYDPDKSWSPVKEP